MIQQSTDVDKVSALIQYEVLDETVPCLSVSLFSYLLHSVFPLESLSSYSHTTKPIR